MDQKKVLVRLCKAYKATQNNEKKLKKYIDERHDRSHQVNSK